jgi:23S rRNA pseudouridine1911/1915/1917 synthase
MEKSFPVFSEDAGSRVDLFLAEKTGLSRNKITRAIENGKVTLNGQPIKKHHQIKIGEVFELDYQEPAPLKAEPEKIPLKIIFEDKDILVINKPAGMVTHPAPGNPAGTLVNAVLGYLPELKKSAEDLRPGLIHRLDKDTSGVMVITKNEKAQDFLARQLKEGKFQKKYWAVVFGIPKKKEGEIDLPIGRNQRDRKKMAVIRNEKLRRRSARTIYRLIEEFNSASLLEVQIITGRTHQIRVHLLAIGHPVLGDQTYTKKKTNLIGRQALHAKKLGFIHPTSKKFLEFEAELPQDMKELLEKLRDLKKP